MAQDDALGLAGGAGGVLDHREGIARRVVFDPAVGVGAREFVGGEPPDRSDATGHRFELGDRGRGAEREARTGVAGNGVEAVERAAARRVGGNGDAAGVENAEECRNEFEAGRVRKHDALARKAHVLEAGGDRACTTVELSVRHRRVP